MSHLLAAFAGRKLKLTSCLPPNWYMRWMLRRYELPDLPEVRRALWAWWRKGWTFGAAPSSAELRALHQEAVAAVIRALPDDDAL